VKIGEIISEGCVCRPVPIRFFIQHSWYNLKIASID
jgi:hypothetical protein